MTENACLSGPIPRAAAATQGDHTRLTNSAILVMASSACTLSPSVQNKDKASNVWVWDNPQEPSSQWVLEANIPVASSSGISPWSLPQQQLELHVFCFSNERLLVMSCTDEKKLEVKKPPFDIGEISDSNPWSHFRAQKKNRPKNGPTPCGHGHAPENSPSRSPERHTKSQSSAQSSSAQQALLEADPSRCGCHSG